MGIDQKDGVTKTLPFREHRAQPIAQGGHIPDVAGFDRPFNSAGIGKGADGKSGRKPGQQAVERRAFRRRERRL